MAVRNGEAFIKEQIQSIICQLAPDDEFVISDDNSNDATIEIVRNFDDRRIRVFSGPGSGILRNFENALQHASGEYIFLADQDDIWHNDKLRTMMPYLDRYDVVVCDCTLVTDNRDVICNSFFELNGSGQGFIRNLIRNSYMGCCMGIRRRVLERALPFPSKAVIHDFWIGMIAETHYRSVFIKKLLVSHRLHASNASTSGRKSITRPLNKVVQRYQMVSDLISRGL